MRALRVSKYVAADADAFANLLDLAEKTIVNALVFDTKDESGYVLHETAVEAAATLNSVRVMFDSLSRGTVARVTSSRLQPF